MGFKQKHKKILNKVRLVPYWHEYPNRSVSKLPIYSALHTNTSARYLPY